MASLEFKSSRCARQRHKRPTHVRRDQVCFTTQTQRMTCTESPRPLPRKEIERKLTLNWFSLALRRKRECCLLVLNLVSSTLPCIRQPDKLKDGRWLLPSSPLGPQRASSTWAALHSSSTRPVQAWQAPRAGLATTRSCRPHPCQRGRLAPLGSFPSTSSRNSRQSFFLHPRGCDPREQLRRHLSASW
jgi:hypothetical protein